MRDKLAIVILNYNGAVFLKKFLPSVLQNSKPHRVIVADNASSDQSVALLQNQFPEVDLLLLDQNWGFAGGYNKALEKINAEFYLLLNSDVEVTEGWLPPLLELLEKDSNIAACQPKIKAYDQPLFFEYAGAAGGFIDWLAYPFCRGRIFDTLEQDFGQYDNARPVFWATGACMLIRADVYWHLGGFDDDFFAHMEEIDLCWRINTAGWQVWACPDSTVYHVGGGTLPKSNPRKTYLNFRNGLWMLIKNSRNELIIKLPLRIMLDWLAALFFLLKGSKAEAGAVIKSHYDTIKSVEKLYKKRKHTTNQQDQPALLTSNLIIIEYYLRKRKNFSELGKE